MLLVAANVLVFLLELAGGTAFIRQWALVPSEIVAGRHWITLVTAMFLHGGVMHIVGNMVFFWAFAPEIEDAMGHVRFLAFYLIGGVVAFLVQIAVAPHSTVPNVGASGAIAGKVLSLRPAVVEDAPIVPVAWVCASAEAPDKMKVMGANLTNVKDGVLPLDCRALKR